MKSHDIFLMKSKFILLTGLLIGAVVFGPQKASSQLAEVRNAVYSDVSIPLRDMKPVKNAIQKKWMKGRENEVPNKFRPVSPISVADAAVQSVYNNGNKAISAVPIQNFNGLSNTDNTGGHVSPPDPAGDVGPTHYVQAVNNMLQIYSKTGTSLYGPVTTATLWSGFTGNWDGHNDGDATVLYDENADRWIISQFAIDCPGSPYAEYQMVAVSTTPDPTGSYYRYAFQFDYLPDYGKLGVWNDGYYMSMNRFNSNSGGSFVGVGAAVMERSKMLTGDPTARMVYFKTENLGGSGSGAGSSCYSMLPSDCDGTFAAAGTPNYFIYDNQATSELRIWALHADWNIPANSTFTYTTKFTVAAYTEAGSVSQQGTPNKLDGVGDRLMFRNQYRNFGTYETFVTCRNVSVNGASGMRWYEFRKTGSTFSLHQQSTYAPGDGKSRWMGSVAMNGLGDIGMAYSVSGSSMYPSIYFTGRKAADALNQMTIPEGIIQTGAVSMASATRWGDYTAMNIDPTDNQTFWTTQEYVSSALSWPWSTRIASFLFASTPVVTTLAATAVTGTAATVNGTVNPNGFATNYHFEWGTTPAYGNSTSIVAAGSGNTALAVNAPVSGLTAGTSVHYRIVGVNSEGTSYGNDLTFTPGAASLTTAPATAITLTGTTSGGTITTDGGSTVTARGVCWATTTNPVATGNHTADGSGTGTFISSITGLSANTIYHLRAYAINGIGTYYGDEVTFMTLCGNYTLPFSESFPGTSLPACWSQMDNQGSGQVWQFGTITGQTPNPALTGNYTYVNSDAYGGGGAQNADLITPAIDMSTYSSVNLQFRHYFKGYTGTSAAVSYSINNGTTWTVIQYITTTSATNPVIFSQAIAAVAGQSQVKFKWNYTGSWGFSWAIDDVLVTGTGTAVSLTVTPANQNVASTAGTTLFTVTTPATWTATSNSAWCIVTPFGTGNGMLTATFAQNTVTASRIANITIEATGAPSVIVTVAQAGSAPTLSVTPANQNVTAPAGNAAFTVASNSAWTATSNASWCTVTSGTGNGTLVATYTQNILLTSRTALVTVTVTGLAPVVVTVTQAAGSATLAVTPANQNVSAAAGSTGFVVNSNSAWTASSSEAWCIVTPSGTGDGTLEVTYSLNALVTTRIASITVSVTGNTPVTITVTQSGSAPYLSVTPANQNVAAPAGNTSFNILSNSAWNISCDAAWCSVPLSGTGNGTLAATYPENTSLSDRTANITVTVAGLAPVVVTLTQGGASPTLIVTPVNINVSASAGTAGYTVMANAPWTATCNTTWVIVTPAGNGNGTMEAVYEANTSLNQRVSYLTVAAAGTPNANVTLTQSGAAPYLTVDPQIYNVGASAGSTIFTVSSNMPWVAGSNAAWCTITNSGNGSGTVTATFSENTFAELRTADITVTATGIMPISATVKVIQTGPSAALNVGPAVRTVTEPAGSTTFDVTANTSWICTSDANWCQVTTSGTGNGVITATYQQNLTPVIRTASIQVTGEGTFPATVKVVQLPSFVSVSENQVNTLQVNPNPTNGIFILCGSGFVMPEMKVTIMDSKGVMVLARHCSGANSYAFDLSDSDSGNYFLKIETGGTVHLLKLVKQ